MTDGVEKNGKGEEPRFTERFPEERATERFDEPRATARFEEAAPGESPRQAPAGTLSRGETVDGRYRVEEGPIGDASGEAVVYRCTDLESGGDVALKHYHDKMAPKQAVVELLLSIRHRDVVAIRGWGAWGGRAYEVMDYCAGGSLAEFMPFDEEALARVCRAVVRGLHHLHQHGIVHRDIKPTNLFFLDAERTDIVIGDFGVSSMLEPGERVHKTASAHFFTLDYAAPELLDGKEVGPKTDYYALGVTLLHLLTGRSPFHGMDRTAVLGAHFRGRVPRPEGMSPGFTRLINGLLRVHPESRWGYAQVRAWVRGEPVFTDEGIPDREEVAAGRRIPYRSLPEITTPREMARRLGDFDVKRDMLRGFVSQWVMLFDTNLGREVARIEEKYADHLETGAFKLKYLLDPTLPLEFGDSQAVNIQQLVDMLAAPFLANRDELVRLFRAGCVEIWVKALGGDPAATDALAQRIRDIRVRVKDHDVALFALMHVLDPARPLAFGPARVKSPEEIPRLVQGNAAQTGRLVSHLFSGRLAEWMRAAFPERGEDVAFLERCAREHSRADADLAVFRVCCHFEPATPIRIGVGTASTPAELAAAIARTPQSMEEGAGLLSRGWMRAWLVETGRMKDPAPFDEVIADPVSSWSRKLEAVLKLLNPDLGGPVVLADAEELDGGRLTREDTKMVRVTIFNGGRGHLSGTVTLETVSPGFAMADVDIEGNGVTAVVHLSGQGLEPGSLQEARIVAETNGGRLVIPVHFEVARPGWRALGRTLRSGLAVAAVMGIYRLTVAAVEPARNLMIVPWPRGDEVLRGDRVLVYLVLMMLLANTVIVGGMYLISVIRLNRSGDDGEGGG
ncbi:MAG TPA: serine/threonine-protein kinase [Candidatus Hydrogenedentes bacterium]|nr:serine/threonine-protein kinase [Candidatus Hydrogenedentota bacterium]